MDSSQYKGLTVAICMDLMIYIARLGDFGEDDDVDKQ